MNTLKRKNMMAAYTGFKGHQTVQAVTKQIPEELFDRLTGRELGIVMSAINAAYHSGKADAGAEITGDCLWYGGKLIPTEAIKAIKVEEFTETIAKKPCPQFPSETETWTTRKYVLNWTERF